MEFEPVMEAEITAPALLDYQADGFSQGSMNFTWAELTPAARAAAYAEWQQGKGLIGGNPRLRPGSHLLPTWGLDQPFFRALALEDARAGNGDRLRAALATACPLEIEIGYGRGDFLLDRARRHPQTLLLGYEVSTKATRLMLPRLERYHTANVWLSDDDCRFNLPRVVANGRADLIHILFPDPWWKNQYHNKRLFSPPFVDLLAAKLRPGALLHFKSDVQEYGEWVRYLVEDHPEFTNHDPTLAARIGDYAPTHREAWCLRSGKPIWAYYFQRR